MATTSESLTQKWLRQNIHLYTHKETVYAQVDATLSRFSTLRPKTDVYTYDDGRTQLLLCVHGLLPIAYRGTSYHIPIAVWLTREYPRIPPIAYVVPTTDMLVRSGQYMEVSGRCQIEYLKFWERKSEGCSLTALLEAMQDHFSREPPVYAKPKSAPSSSSSPQPRRTDTTVPSYSERPPPPLPGAQTSPGPHSQPVSAQITTAKNDDRPPVPLKPGVNPTQPSAVPSSRDVRSTSPNVLNPASLVNRPPPPLPSHTPTNIGYSQQQDPSILPRYDAPARELASTSNTPVWPNDLRMRPPPAPPAVDAPASPPQIPPPALSAPHSAPGGGHYYSQPVQPVPRPPAPPATFSPLAQSPAQSTGQYHYSGVPHPPPFLSPQSTGTLQTSAYGPPQVPVHPASHVSPPPPPPPTIPAPDLLDDDDQETANPVQVPGLFAPAPPRPPNPELLRLHGQVHGKLTSELASLSQAMSLDAERLRANQADLLTGEPAIRDEMARLEAVRDVCRNVAGRLRTVVEAAERNVSELKRKGDPEVDELVCSTTIVHNQLINLVAEDNAIEDTMYHLHRALNAGRIDLERFLKATRVLAEEQFMKRALIEKILTGIPIGSQWQ